MNPRTIPVSMVIAGCLYLAVGAIGAVAHACDLRQPDGVWAEVSALLAIVSGVFIFRRKNWARWLALAWMALHVVLSIQEPRALAIHSLFLIAIGWLLFRREGQQYFGGKEIV